MRRCGLKNLVKQPHFAGRIPQALVIAARWSSTVAEGLSDDHVIKHARWSSDDLYERLGISDRGADTVLIKKHYHILVKHYHPDQAGDANKDAAEAFRKIREAYEILSEADHRRLYDKDGKDYFSKRDNAFYANVDPRRVAFLQMLRGGLPLFFVGCIIFAVIVGRRNRAAFQAAYFTHLVLIFAVLQVFPRILAAIVIFAVHSKNLGEILSLSEQGSGSVILTPDGSKSFVARPGGLSAKTLSNADKLLTTLEYSKTDAASGATTVTSVQFRNNGGPITAPRIPEASYRMTIYDEARGVTVLDTTFAFNSV